MRALKWIEIMINRKNRVEPTLILQSVNNVTNCKGNNKEQHFFFSFYKVFAVNPTQIESRVQKNHGIGDQVLATILGSRGTKMGWNCDSDREKGKYNRKIPTAKSGFLLNTWNNRFLKFRLGKYVTLLKPWLGAFHILRNSGNSGWDCNGTHVFQAFHWKVPGNNWNLKR